MYENVEGLNVFKWNHQMTEINVSLPSLDLNDTVTGYFFIKSYPDMTG